MEETNYILTMVMPVESGNLINLRGFYKEFATKGNLIKVMGQNDINLVFIKFAFKTPDAIIWMYRWIHMFMLDGEVNQSRDNEIQWLVGTPDFIDIVYQILYKKHFGNKGEKIVNIYSKEA